MWFPRKTITPRCVTRRLNASFFACFWSGVGPWETVLPETGVAIPYSNFPLRVFGLDSPFIKVRIANLQLSARSRNTCYTNTLYTWIGSVFFVLPIRESTRLYDGRNVNFFNVKYAEMRSRVRKFHVPGIDEDRPSNLP